MVRLRSAQRSGGLLRQLSLERQAPQRAVAMPRERDRALSTHKRPHDVARVATVARCRPGRLARAYARTSIAAHIETETVHIHVRGTRVCAHCTPRGPGRLVHARLYVMAAGTLLRTWQPASAARSTGRAHRARGKAKWSHCVHGRDARQSGDVWGWRRVSKQRSGSFVTRGFAELLALTSGFL